MVKLTSNEKIENAGDKFVLTHQIDMPAGYQGQLHHHVWYQLMYASKGVLNVEYQNQIMLVPPQKAIWLPPNCHHRVRVPMGAHFHSVYFRPDVVAELGDESKVLSITALVRELILAVGELTHFENTLDDKGLRLTQVLIDQLSLQEDSALSLLIPSDKRLNKLVSAIIQTPCNALNLEQWSKELGLSSRTISRLFNKDVGMGFKEWRQKVRLLEAINLLEQGLSVTQVALDVGYQSPSAFTYAFKQVFKTNPVRYLGLNLRGK